MSEDMKTYTCQFHNTEVERSTACQKCLREYPNLPDVETMTTEEKVNEVRLRVGRLTVPFKMVEARINALVGRDCMSSEFGNVERLVDEIRTGKRPTGKEIIEDMARMMRGEPSNE